MLELMCRITTDPHTLLFWNSSIVNSIEVLNYNWSSYCLIRNMLRKILKGKAAGCVLHTVRKNYRVLELCRVDQFMDPRSLDPWLKKRCVVYIAYYKRYYTVIIKTMIINMYCMPWLFICISYNYVFYTMSICFIRKF